MGWLCYDSYYYDKHGRVDRKAEMDSIHTWENELKSVSVLKSAMIGSTYYAAVQVLDKVTGERTVTAAVCLTCGSKDNGGFNFGYKGMDETYGPYNYDCPKGILDLLTPTDNEYANEWRRRCEEERKIKNAKQNATKAEFKFPYQISWSNGYTIEPDEPVVLEHRKFGKTRKWFLPGTYCNLRPSTMKMGELIRVIE